MNASDQPLTTRQLERLRKSFQHGTAEAAAALSVWLDKPVHVTLESFQFLPLGEATGLLGAGDEPWWFCIMRLPGEFSGQIILAFDGDSGLLLADILLSQPRGTATGWGEMEQSAALESTNIIGCSWLNALSRTLPELQAKVGDLVPDPPLLKHEYAESLIEFVLMSQVLAGDSVLLTRTTFELDGEPVNWTLLFVPEAGSLAILKEVLP